MQIKDFNKQLMPKTALIAFDYGSKRIGIAVSDILRMIANPYTIIERKSWDKDLQQILHIIKEKEIGGMVFGLPLQMNGQEGQTAEEARSFATKVAAAANLPYIFWDERLSSVAAENFLIGSLDMSRAKRKENLDSAAACYILQGVLEALKKLG